MELLAQILCGQIDCTAIKWKGYANNNRDVSGYSVPYSIFIFGSYVLSYSLNYISIIIKPKFIRTLKFSYFIII